MGTILIQIFQHLPFWLAIATALVIDERDIQGTANIYLGENTGPTEHLASGILYGIPDTPNQIPDHYYTDMAFRNCRAGGSRLVEPSRGWIFGEQEFQVCSLHPMQNKY